MMRGRPHALPFSRSREKVARASATDEGRRAKRDGGCPNTLRRPFRACGAALIRPSGTFSRRAGEGQ